MATTRIMPLHAGKGRTVGKAISDIIDYVKNPEKTDHGRDGRKLPNVPMRMGMMSCLSLMCLRMKSLRIGHGRTV